MTRKINKKAYADMYGPTVGDKVIRCVLYVHIGDIHVFSKILLFYY